jgi:hypothetical protein
MPRIAGRDQLLLLPETVDDYVEADNSVRFLDAFVDGLDLVGAGFARVDGEAGLCAPLGWLQERVSPLFSEPTTKNSRAGDRDNRARATGDVDDAARN